MECVNWPTAFMWVGCLWAVVTFLYVLFKMECVNWPTAFMWVGCLWAVVTFLYVLFKHG